MRKSEKVSCQFMAVINLLDLVDSKLQRIEGDSEKIYEFHNKISELLEEIEEFHYETCMPLEMEENERDEEIDRLEKRLATLKAQ